MSTVFSRRAFLKYTAVAAVAVAGTSLLGGCSGEETPVCNDVGENASNTVLQIKSTLTKVDFKPDGDTATVTFHLHIANVGRVNEIYVNPQCFSAKADELPYPSTMLSFHLENGSYTISRGKEADCTITMQNVDASVQELTLAFWPDPTYQDYYARWILAPEKFNPASGTTEQPSEGQTD